MSQRYPLVSIEHVEDIPDRDALSRVLETYMSGMLDLLRSEGGPDLRPADALGDIWGTMDAYLPPTGRVFLALDDQKRIMGCGFLRQVRPDAGEMKRLYVAPEARGSGLGARLIEARIAAARAMGWTTLLADTVRGNDPMLRLYARYGFRDIPRYPENANSEDMAPYLVFLQCDLDRAGSG